MFDTAVTAYHLLEHNVNFKKTTTITFCFTAIPTIDNTDKVTHIVEKQPQTSRAQNTCEINPAHNNPPSHTEPNSTSRTHTTGTDNPDKVNTAPQPTCRKQS